MIFAKFAQFLFDIIAKPGHSRQSYWALVCGWQSQASESAQRHALPPTALSLLRLGGKLPRYVAAVVNAGEGCQMVWCRLYVGIRRIAYRSSDYRS